MDYVLRDEQQESLFGCGSFNASTPIQPNQAMAYKALNKQHDHLLAHLLYYAILSENIHVCSSLMHTSK
jgi:hypothetical protein